LSYRDRLSPQRQPRTAEVEAYEIDQCFRRVFGGAEGQRVLDFIVQRICGVDAIVPITSEAAAYEMLVRKNVGLDIARRALGSTTDDKPEVRT
jgi:hypothetical protein